MAFWFKFPVAHPLIAGRQLLGSIEPSVALIRFGLTSLT
jgi:hypothetical protein